MLPKVKCRPHRPTDRHRAQSGVYASDVGDDRPFMHDLASTDKNRPTVNPNGPVYAVSAGHGSLVVLNQRTNSTEELEIPTRAPRAQVPSRFPAPNRPSLHWGNEHLWANPPYNPADPHNPMLDSKGRVWMTSKIRPNADPAWCNDSANKFAAWFPLRNSGRQASFYDPKTRQFVLIDTCDATHHLQFDNDPNENGGLQPAVGSDRRLDRLEGLRRDEGRAESCWLVRASRGYQRRRSHHGAAMESDHRAWRVAPLCGRHQRGQRAWCWGAGARGEGGGPDPELDTLVSFSLYGVIPSPVDDSIWGVAERYPGYLVRVDCGKNPPQSCMAEIYKVPEPGFDPRGVDIDTNGVVWTALAASSHLELRPPEVQGDHRTAQGGRQRVRGRLDAV